MTDYAAAIIQENLPARQTGSVAFVCLAAFNAHQFLVREVLFRKVRTAGQSHGQLDRALAQPAAACPFSNGVVARDEAAELVVAEGARCGAHCVSAVVQSDTPALDA